MKKSFLQTLEEASSEILASKGFIKIFDNDDVPYEDKSSFTQHVKYSNGEKTLLISAEDWRDSYFIYFIELNGIRLAEASYLNGKDLAIEKLLKALRTI